jgi:hypothetical protein
MNNKLKLSALLLGGALSLNAQTDTICTMVRSTDVLEFNYQTSEVIDNYVLEDTFNIYVEADEILCLHLYTEKRGKLKVVTVHDGHPHVDFLQGKDNVYYTSGPAQVIVFKK